MSPTTLGNERTRNSTHERARRTRNGGSLNTRAWVLLMLLTVALTAVGLLGTFASRTGAESATTALNQDFADDQAYEFSSLVTSYERLLAVATSLGAREPSAGQKACGLSGPDLKAAGIELISDSGEQLCASPDATNYRIAAPGYLRKDGGTQLLTVQGSHDLLMARASGPRLLAIPIGRHTLEPAFIVPGRAPDLRVALADEHGNVLFAADAAGHDLTRVSQDPLRDIRTARSSASSPVTGTPWTVFVSASGRSVWAAARTQLKLLHILLATIFIGGIGVFIAVKHGLIRPMRQLREEVSAAVGKLPVSKSGPLELTLIREAFTTVLRARDRAQEKLSHALVTVIRTRESEKQQLAIELHDSAVQTLTIAGWALDDALSTSGRPSGSNWTVPMPSSEVRRVRDLIQSTAAELRQKSHELLPVTLRRKGLVPAVEALAESASSDALKVTVEHHGPTEKLTQAAQALAFRTIQEALRNVVKHSQAQNASIRMHVSSGVFYASVRDDGVGFTQDQLEHQEPEQHFGVVSMNESIELVGGKFSLRSAGDGTLLKFAMPLNSPEPLVLPPEILEHTEPPLEVKADREWSEAEEQRARRELNEDLPGTRRALLPPSLRGRRRPRAGKARNADSDSDVDPDADATEASPDGRGEHSDVAFAMREPGAATPDSGAGRLSPRDFSAQLDGLIPAPRRRTGDDPHPGPAGADNAPPPVWSPRRARRHVLWSRRDDTQFFGKYSAPHRDKNKKRKR